MSEHQQPRVNGRATTTMPDLAGSDPTPAPRPVAPAVGTPRIAYIINLFPNFIETMIYREVDALRQRGYEISMFSIRRPADALIPPEAHHLAAKTHYILPIPPARLVGEHLRALLRYRLRYWRILIEVLRGSHSGWRDRFRTLCHFVEAVTILPEISRLGVDHIHAHWAVGSATCAMVISRFLGIPFSFTAHAYDIWRERLLLPEKLRAARLTLTCTDCNRRHLIDAHGADPSRVRVVYHGLSVDRFQPRPHRTNPVPVIISVGRLVEQKGFDRLLHACAALAVSGRRFRCEIVGDGPLRAELEDLASRLGLSADVRFLGMLSQDELIERYAAADVFALLCVPAADDDRDGIPNTAIEAMAMGLPVVSTRFSGVPELVVDGTTGMLVDTDDIDGAVAALRALMEDANARRRMGAAGRRRVIERFTIEASTTALDDAFRGVLASRLQSSYRDSAETGSVSR